VQEEVMVGAVILDGILDCFVKEDWGLGVAEMKTEVFVGARLPVTVIVKVLVTSW
jgi:hypothetical protein